MAEVRMTARNFYEAIATAANEGKIDGALGEYAQNAIEKIDARANATSSKKAAEYKVIWDQIKSVLTEEPLTAGEVTHAVNEGYDMDYNVQKIAPAISKLCTAGGATKVEIKVKGRKTNGYIKVAE